MVEPSSGFNEENRASTIFPIYLSKEVKTKVVFLGYWSLKNNLSDYICRCTLYDREGKRLAQVFPEILECKAYTFNVNQMFDKNIDPQLVGFQYSLEIEIFFKDKPRFNFPALTLVYETEKGSSCVHSGVRSYDLNESSHQDSIDFPQTGFDVFHSKGVDSRILFNNIKEDSCYNIKLRFENLEGDSYEFDQLIKAEKSYMLHELSLSQILEKLQAKNGRYSVRIEHNIADFFPRFYCVNTRNDHHPTLTHTFYDMSSVTEPSAIQKYSVKNKNKEAYYDAVFSVPIVSMDDFITELVCYDSNMYFKGDVRVELYSSHGNKVGEIIESSRSGGFLQKFSAINLCDLLHDFIDGKKETDLYTAQFSFSSTDRSQMTTRLKYGLNIYRKGHIETGTNICFAAEVYSEETVEKKGFRKWAPVGGKDDFQFYLINSRLEKSNETEAVKMELLFINEKGEQLKRSHDTLNNQLVIVDSSKDSELSSFLEGETGWVFVNGSTNIVNAWFFSLGEELVGGDHSF